MQLLPRESPRERLQRARLPRVRATSTSFTTRAFSASSRRPRESCSKPRLTLAPLLPRPSLDFARWIAQCLPLSADPGAIRWRAIAGQPQLHAGALGYRPAPERSRPDLFACLRARANKSVVQLTLCVAAAARPPRARFPRDRTKSTALAVRRTRGALSGNSKVDWGTAARARPGHAPRRERRQSVRILHAPPPCHAATRSGECNRKTEDRKRWLDP